MGSECKSRSVVGDGIHDDTAGIQKLLDRGSSAVYLPSPPNHYLISRTLVIHSHQTLRLDPFSVIRLAPHSDTVMISNDDHTHGNENIELLGGIWDMDTPARGALVRNSGTMDGVRTAGLASENLTALTEGM